MALNAVNSRPKLRQVMLLDPQLFCLEMDPDGTVGCWMYSGTNTIMKGVSQKRKDKRRKEKKERLISHCSWLFLVLLLK